MEKNKKKSARGLLTKDPTMSNSLIQEELRSMGYEHGITPAYLASVRADLGVSGPGRGKSGRVRGSLRDEEQANVSSRTKPKARPKKGSPHKVHQSVEQKQETDTPVIPAGMLKYIESISDQMAEAGIYEMTIDAHGNVKADVRRVMRINILE
jgi:hypothetical protein